MDVQETLDLSFKRNEQTIILSHVVLSPEVWSLKEHQWNHIWLIADLIYIDSTDPLDLIAGWYNVLERPSK